MAVTADLGLSAGVYQTKTQDLTTSEDQLAFRRGVHLSSGTGAGKADKVFHDQRTLAASATEDLDLAGVLTDAFGAVITFAKIKGLYISAAAANVNNVIVGAGTTPWVTLLNSTGTITLRPGASFGAMAGVADATAYAVTATTADILKIANSGAGTSVVYDIVIVGTSA